MAHVELPLICNRRVVPLRRSTASCQLVEPASAGPEEGALPHTRQLLR